MELNGTDVVHVALKREHALLDLVVPHLDEMIITSRDKHWLGFMEINASDGAIMILEFVDKALGAIVEQMNASIMERSEDPGAILMEGQAFDTLALRLKLSLHHLFFFVFLLIFSLTLTKIIDGAARGLTLLLCESIVVEIILVEKEGGAL